MSIWIKCADKLPELCNQKWSEEVLAILKDGTMHILNRTDMGAWMNMQGQYTTKDESVTHWMPLPNPPEQTE